jgi:hypothetical protein
MKKYSTASVWPERNSSSPLIQDGRRVLTEIKQNSLKRGLNEPEVYLMCEITADRYPEGTNAINRRISMKQIVGFIGLAFLQLMVACSSTAPWETREWQPAAVTDFKSVAGKWEGLLTSNDPRVLNFDRATLVIDDTGTCESTITRTRTRVSGMSVDYGTTDVFAEKGKLVLADGKLSTKFEKGGQLTAQLHVDSASGERMLQANGKNSQGFTYSANLKRTGDFASGK